MPSKDVLSGQVGLHAQMQGKANQQLRPALRIAVQRLPKDWNVYRQALRSKGRPAKAVAGAECGGCLNFRVGLCDIGVAGNSPDKSANSIA